MAAVKWIFVVLCGLGGVSALALGLVSSGEPRTPRLASAPPLSLRAFAGGAVAVAAQKAAPEAVAEKAPDAARTPEKSPEPVAVKTPAPVAVKTPEPVAV